MTGFERLALVEQPRKADGSQRNDDAKNSDGQVELSRLDALDRPGQPVVERIDTRHVEQAAQDRKRCQRHQRDGHNQRTFLGVFGHFVARRAEEDHPDLAAHVESRQESGGDEQAINQREVLAGLGQNLVFRPETGQRPNPCQGQRADDIHPERDRHLLAQAAHVAHIAGVENFVDRLAMMAVVPIFGSVDAILQVVVSALHAQDHGTRRKEEQRLEKGVRQQVEHPGHVAAHADRRHHESKLADGGVGQHLFDVILPDGNRRGEERR